jgi:uncharacterized protein (TIGR00255 family)
MNSMTGFVFDVVKTEQGIFTLSLRSLNHRYLDIYVKLPETLKTVEFDIRQLLQNRLKRGKVEFVLKFQPNADSLSNFSINTPLFDKLSTTLQQLQQTIPSARVELTRLLNWPGILMETEVASDILHEKVLQETNTMLDKLLQTRQKEGLQLKQYIKSTLQIIERQLKIIKKHIKTAIENQQKKLTVQFNQLKVEVDQARFAQEVALLVQKADITEEVDRLETYIGETYKILQKKGQIGRRLDFLMQELNREANTVCSKSVDVNITQAAIEIKVLIEQIREQAQNLE